MTTTVNVCFRGLLDQVLHIPFGHALATIGVNQLDVFGPEVTDDLSRILLVSRANLEFTRYPLTLPHEKQRTGMIILAARDGDVGGMQVVRPRSASGLVGESKIGLKNSELNVAQG